MPPETLVSGAEGTVTINVNPVVVGQTYDFAQTRNVMQKSFVGQPWGHALAGQRRASFSASGSVSAESQPDLQAAFEAGSIPVTVQIGTAAGATDAGLYSGEFAVNDFSITVNGDGEWDWSLSAESDGAVTYTPPGS